MCKVLSLFVAAAVLAFLHLSLRSTQIKEILQRRISSDFDKVEDEDDGDEGGCGRRSKRRRWGREWKEEESVYFSSRLFWLRG